MDKRPSLPEPEQEQLDRLVSFLRELLGETLAGAYLFGSATSSGLKPRSDLDVIAVVSTRMTTTQKTQVISKLLAISGVPRHLEVTIVVETEVRPWSYPPRMEFQYGDWWRKEFEQGNLQPWEELNPDLASLITMVLDSSIVLHGPPPDEVFDRVPRADYTKASQHGIDGLMNDLPSDTTNVVLTLARIWSALATGESRPKDAAASWALPHLPEEHRPVLDEARAIYLGESEGEPSDFASRAQRYAGHVLAKIADTDSRT